MVFVRGMVSDFKRLGGSSPHKETSDIELGFITINTPHAEAVFSEVFKSLKETVGKVVSHIEFFSFAFDLVVDDLPEGETFMVEVIETEVHSGLFVRGVGDQSLEIEEIKFGFGETVQRIFLFGHGGLGFVLFLLLGFFLFLGFFLLLGFFFLLGLGGGGSAASLEYPLGLAESGLAESFLPFFLSTDEAEPSGEVHPSVSQFFIDDELEQVVQLGSDGDICHRDLKSLQHSSGLQMFIQEIQQLSKVIHSFLLKTGIGRDGTKNLGHKSLTNRGKFLGGKIEPRISLGSFKGASVLSSDGRKISQGSIRGSQHSGRGLENGKFS